MKYKEALEQVLANLRCIDVTENEQVESYVDDSIKIIKEVLEGTALEVPVQEQLKDKANITVNKDTAIIQTSKEISIIL